MKVNYKRIISVCAASLVLGAVCVQGAPLAPDEALARLTEDAPKKIGSRQSLQLVHTAVCPGTETPAFYVFEHEGKSGFMIVSADDNAAPMLAYVDNAAFDPDDMPAALRYWLDEYADQMAFVSAQPSRTGQIIGEKRIVAADSRQAIAPICKTKWDQRNPYNDQCPMINGRRAATGCAATAMAQVMKVHQWPEKGKGAVSYTTGDLNLYMDFDEAEFAWDKMLDVYNTQSTTTSRDAVALLMKACGYSSYMKYSAVESGTVITFVGGALYNNFGYANSCVLHRDVFTDSKWESIVYEELAAGRPVIYTGNDVNDAGHAFVCDGYDTEGLYHINWGWGGRYDGFFRLSALNPSGVGTGGGSGSYNYSQTMVINIAPKGTQGLAPYYPFYATAGFMIDRNYSGSQPYMKSFNFSDGYMLSDSAVQYVGCKLGVILVKDGERVTEWEGPGVSFPAYQYGGDGYLAYEKFVVHEDTEGLTPGTYCLYPGVKVRNFGWYQVPVMLGHNQCVYMTIAEDGSVTYSNEAPQWLPDVEIWDINLPERLVSEENADISFQWKNGEKKFEGEIYIVARAEDQEYSLVTVKCGFGADASGEETINVPVNIPAGEYEMWFADQAGNELSARFVATVDAPYGITSVNKEGDATPEYYDLSGRRTPSSSSGILIEKTAKDSRIDSRIILKKLN